MIKTISLSYRTAIDTIFTMYQSQHTMLVVVKNSETLSLNFLIMSTLIIHRYMVAIKNASR